MFRGGQFIVERAVYIMQLSRKVKWIFLMGIVNIHFIVCSCVYRICSEGNGGIMNMGQYYI